MSDFQFVCPFCEQVLDCPVEYDGLETECPVCKNQIVPIANNGKNDIFQKTSVGNKPIVNPNTDNVVVQTIQPPNKFKIENEFLAAKKSINFLIKWIIIAIFVVATGIFAFYFCYNSSAAQHKRKMKNLAGTVVLDKYALAVPSNNILYFYMKKSDSIAYCVMNPKLEAIKSLNNKEKRIRVYPTLIFSLLRNNCKLCIEFSNTKKLDKKCVFEFASGCKLELENPIEIPLDVYYAYFILDTPVKITTKIYSQDNTLNDLVLTKEQLDVKYFKQMAELLKIHSPNVPYEISHNFCQENLLVYSYAIKKFVLKNNGNLPKSLLHLREDNYCNNVNFCPISSKIYSYRLENLKDIEINNLAPDEIIIFCSGCKKGLRCDGKITESISLALMDKPVKKQQDSRVFVSAALYDSFDRKTIPFIKEVTITPQDHEGEKMLQKFKQYMQKLKIIEPEVERAPEMDKLGRSKAYRRLSIIELQQKILEVDMQFAVDRNFVLNSYRVKNFDSGEAMFKNIPPGKYIVTAYGAHHNVNCRWFFAVEKTKYKPLKINLTNDDNCFIQVTKEVIIKPQIKQFAR